MQERVWHQLSWHASPFISSITITQLFRYYCMAAAAALIKYVEHVQNVLFAQSSLKITYEALSKVCFIGKYFLLFLIFWLWDIVDKRLALLGCTTPKFSVL